ncbi:SHOCT domain-containing protein [Streptomyces gobiensis]|uniref:SHOCT domain-containing protein n=1 Tax=Streptomyces gobiensis TaxID=2875706 RepID=UPI001E3CB200|nr:SHOCT domain-containing protein [Streptomyces gobiensis]UGY93635.1 SHOCT domain-containing protein [Streptomyces gobiensis]
MCGWMNGMMGGGMGPWMMIVWWLGVLIFLALAVTGLVWLVRSLTGGPGARRPADQETKPADQETPREILRRRYAAGEIDEDEYLRRLSGLDQ